MTVDEFLRTSLTELSERTSILLCNWSSMINGRRDPSFTIICRTANELGMRPEDFVKALDLRRAQVNEKKKCKKVD